MSSRGKRILHIVVAAGLLAAGLAGLAVMTAAKPDLEKRPPEVLAPVVRTVTVKQESLRQVIRGEGTVRPLREISVIPQVAGSVVEIADSLVNGGRFQAGDVLIRIDPRDYELAVTQARARVKEAESRLLTTREEAKLARDEWRLYVGGKDGRQGRTPPPLAAKEPQLEAARAGLESARAEYGRAVLNLERTTIAAPFDGRVSQKMIDIGQYVTPGQPAASIFSTEAAEIVTPFEDGDLQWFEVPGFNTNRPSGAAAVVSSRIAGKSMEWEGRVVRAQGKLDERTRMVNVVVRVDDPYATTPPLAAGLFVNVAMEGRVLDDIVVIPRQALRGDDTVWVVENGGRLVFRLVEPVRVRGDKAFIRSGLKDGDAVVTSNLKVVTDGMSIRAVPDTAEAPLAAGRDSGGAQP